ncbi:MAG: diguanylate cyclase [Desulforhopalus sp.]
MRITKKVFYDLAIWMVGFGLCIGVVFPFFVVMLGVPAETALKTTFFVACMSAGAFAGILNYTLARLIVGVRLRVLAGSMGNVEQNLHEMTFSGDLSGCTPERCMIPVDSEDEIGESAVAFNRLVESLSISMKTQAAVRSFSEMLSGQLEVKSLAENALVHFFKDTDAVGGLILYECEGELKVAASRGLKNPQTVTGSELVRVAIQTGKKQVISIPRDVLIEGVVMDFRPSEIVVLPVTSKNTPVGVIILATARKFSVDHLGLIDLFQQALGLALNNAVAHERLQYLAAIDPLTGVYNRRLGLRRLQEELSKATRVRSSLGVLMVDIDHFKVINDTYGHLVGDCILKSICSTVRGTLRESDIFFRYGGEEFIAVLPASSVEDLWSSGERLRVAIEENIQSTVDGGVKVTASIGGAAYPDHNVENEDQLIQLADKALYRAKEFGRNRVEIAQNHVHMAGSKKLKLPASSPSSHLEVQMSS